MTGESFPQQLYREALAAAPATHEGLATLDARKADAERALETERGKFAECEQFETVLVERQGAINSRINTADKSLSDQCGANTRAVVAALGSKRELPKVLADCAAASRSLTDQMAVLRDALEHVVIVQVPAAQLRTLQARIGVTRATRDWVVAAAHRDLLFEQVLLGPALHFDPSLTINCGEGSRAHVYAAKVAELTSTIDALRREYNSRAEQAQQEAA
jgi:hypothetical protein